MAEIVLARIDDRLIHGQVMTAWLQYSGGNHIVIVDDETAEDEFLKSVLSMSIPSGIKLNVFNCSDGSEFLKNLSGDSKVVILVKVPGTFLKLIESGVNLKQIIIGGMGANPNRSKFYKNISASDEEREALRKIISLGTSVNIHVIPDQNAINAKQFLV